MGNKLCHRYGQKIPSLINKIIHDEFDSKKNGNHEDINNLMQYLESNFNKLKLVSEYINSKLKLADIDFA